MLQCLSLSVPSKKPYYEWNKDFWSKTVFLNCKYYKPILNINLYIYFLLRGGWEFLSRMLTFSLNRPPFLSISVRLCMFGDFFGLCVTICKHWDIKCIPESRFFWSRNRIKLRLLVKDGLDKKTKLKKIMVLYFSLLIFFLYLFSVFYIYKYILNIY